MPPFLSHVKLPILDYATHSQLAVRGMDLVNELKVQWHNTNDILSLVLLLGPDIVHRALAQLVGRSVTPVAFSFG